VSRSFTEDVHPTKYTYALVTSSTHGWRWLQVKWKWGAKQRYLAASRRRMYCGVFLGSPFRSLWISKMYSHLPAAIQLLAPSIIVDLGVCHEHVDEIIPSSTAHLIQWRDGHVDLVALCSMPVVRGLAPSTPNSRGLSGKWCPMLMTECKLSNVRRYR
jgi:hypothetical protein